MFDDLKLMEAINDKTIRAQKQADSLEKAYDRLDAYRELIHQESRLYRLARNFMRELEN